MGYYLAGFDVIGVDIKPQTQYPFPFIRRDALSVLADDAILEAIDYIHASPPGQSESQPTMELLLDLRDIPWVVENVEATDKMPGSTVLCGTHFNLTASGRVLKRHRRFSASFPLPDPGPCSCTANRVGGVYNSLGRKGMLRGYKFDPTEARIAMGIDWMSRKGLAQAVPPDYTRWIAECMVNRFYPDLPSRDFLHERYSSGRVERFARL